MFGKLRDKLKSFLGKKEEEPKDKEAPKKEKKKPEKTVEALKKEAKKEIKKQAEKPEKKTEPEKIKEKPKEIEEKEVKKIPSDQELKEEAEKIKEEVPVKFSIGQEKYVPDTEAIKEKSEEIQKEERKEQEEQEEEKPKKSFIKKIFGKKEEKETQKQPEEEPGKAAEEKPAEKPGEGKSFLSKFTSKLTSSTLTQENVDEIFDPLEIILLENNVALEVVDKIKENLSKNLVGKEAKKSEIEQTVTQSLKSSIEAVLLDPPDIIEKIKQAKKSGKPYVIIFFGINGSGKTTSIAKLCHKLQKEKLSCVLAAGDTFRAAAIQQLETHAKRLDVPMIKHDYGSDPTAVAFDAKKYAEKNKINCVLIDTAGRMYTKENLIKQMEKIIRVIQPDLKIFVGESITGNDGTEQARTFHEAVGIDGIILSKADVDEKGGTALSVSQITSKPIYFLGVGQNYDDLETFNKKKILKNLGL